MKEKIDTRLIIISIPGISFRRPFCLVYIDEDKILDARIQQRASNSYFCFRFALSLAFEMINQVKIPIMCIQFNRINKSIKLYDRNNLYIVFSLFLYCLYIVCLTFIISVFLSLYFAKKKILY
jgi:hypothetical protein